MNYKKYNDYELIYMVRENDDSSYDILFNKYLPIIKNIANIYYYGYSTYGYDLDDFVQEGYIAFQKALTKYNEGKNVLFYSFVVLCIHRSLMNFCNSITNDKKNISNIYLDSIENISMSDSLNSIDDYFIYKNNIQEIWNIIYDKKIEYISVFELRWNHFSFLEISKLLDISIRRAQSIYRNCLLYLRKEISKAV